MRNVTYGLETLFLPRSIAVVGASPNSAAPHGKAYKTLLENGYGGKVYAVNPNHTSIHGQPCYAGLEEIPAEVELAVIAVASERVMDALRECVHKGVRSAVILTSGFGEASDGGRKTEEEMAALAQKSGMRIMGPNCVGLVNSSNNVWATFAVPVQQAGIRHPYSFDLISQSGFFGIAIYHTVLEQGVGFDRYASIGNQADVTFSDILQYFVAQGDTKIIGGYIEGLKDGQAFLDAARYALERDKIVLVLKAGCSDDGAKAVLSHTGSLAGSDRSYAALFRQAGVIRADSIGQFTDFLSLAVPGRWPKGKRVAVVSASGGAAVILTDQCTRYGLEMASLQPETDLVLAGILPAFASGRNPVDVTSRVLTEPDILWKCLQTLAADPNADMVVLSVHMLASLIEPVLDDIIRVYRQVEKPFLLVGRLFGSDDVVKRMEERIRAAAIPLIRDESNAIWALSSLVHWQERATRHRRSFCFPREETAAEPLTFSKEPAVLTEHRAMSVLRKYGLPCASGELVYTLDDALKAAKRLGYPVALKMQSPDIVHRTDVGALCLNVLNEQHLRTAYSDLISRMDREQPFAAVAGVLVQKMLPKGIETIIGMKRDHRLGPVIMFGMGGVLAEVINDVTCKVAPLTRYDAEDMLDEIQCRKILQGKRGGTGADKKAIIDALLRVSDLAVQNPEIREIDINPFIVYQQGKGGTAADALIILAE